MIHSPERNPNENDFQLMCKLVELEEKNKLGTLTIGFTDILKHDFSFRGMSEDFKNKKIVM